MIQIEHLVKNYGSNCAVDDISLSIGEGEIVGFLGPNGAGKSTTMNILTGYLSSTAGRVSVAGIDVLGDPLNAKKQIGYLPEQPPLYLDMTVDEYLNFNYELKGCKLPREAHIGEVCEVVRIGDVRKRVIKNLSKGYRQRVGIAQAILGSPDIIILDEPTVGLDPQQLTEIRALVRKLGEKLTVIISSHILSEISELCDHVIILSEGHVVADDDMAELEARMNPETTLRMTVKADEAGARAVLKSIEGVNTVTKLSENQAEGTVTLRVTTTAEADLRDEIFFAMAERRYAVLSTETVEQSLEEIFLSLTAKGKKHKEVND